MSVRAFVLGAALLFVPFHAGAFESDVHFGLTKWLALKAGYAEKQANLIALGDQNTDSGIMDTIELVLEYACLGKHADAAQVAQTYHFPSAAKLPSPAEQRTIVAGSAVARRKVDRILDLARNGKANTLLLRFGEALHVLQDSWAYQGVPDTPAFGNIQCDPNLAWSAPTTKGGFASHKADQTKNWSDDIVATASATYEALTRYPPIDGQRRQALDWKQLQAQVQQFAMAATKQEKRSWFQIQGIQETAFLSLITLPDGSNSTNDSWSNRRLAPLRHVKSVQYDVPADTKAFFDLFFATWLLSAKPESALTTSAHSAGYRELAARLKVWRLRDHGSAAELAHTATRYTQKQLQLIDKLSGGPHAYVHYTSLQDAYFPLLEQGAAVSPLLPYVIHIQPDSNGNRMVAVTKLKHLPYDEIGIIAEKFDGTWRAVGLISTVSH